MMKKVTFTVSVVYDDLENTYLNPLEDFENYLFHETEVKEWDFKDIQHEDIEVEYDDELYSEEEE